MQHHLRPHDRLSRPAVGPTGLADGAVAPPAHRAIDSVPASRTRASLAPELPAAESRPWDALFGAPALSAAEQQALTAVSQVRSVAAGDDLFGRNELARSLWAVRSGDVALGFRSADGVFHVERPVHGPAWLDQSSAWLDDTHAMDARANTGATLVELPLDGLRKQVERFPQLGQRLVTSLAREVQALAANTHELMHKDAPARFAAWLAQRCEVSGLPRDAAGGRVQIRLGERKRDIASQLAITPETLSRLMRSLSRRGVIAVAGYTVQVLDLPALRRIANGY